jgi:hypothetical protein
MVIITVDINFIPNMLNMVLIVSIPQVPSPSSNPTTKAPPNSPATSTMRHFFFLSSTVEGTIAVLLALTCWPQPHNSFQLDFPRG